MTTEEAYAALRDAGEDHEWDDTDVADVFRAIFGRDPTSDEDADPLSLCYAALPA